MWSNVFKNEEMKQLATDIMRPFFSTVYNELYIYLWIIAIYHIFFGFIILAMFFILFRMFHDFQTLARSQNIAT
jgi:hypothetical protein